MGRVVAEGVVGDSFGKYYWVVVEVGNDEVEAKMPEACRELAWQAFSWFDGVDEKLRARLEACDEEAHRELAEAARREGFEYYLPDYWEVALGMAASEVLNDALARGELRVNEYIRDERYQVVRFLLDALPSPGEGIEAFAVYESHEARSLMGAWSYHGGPLDVTTLVGMGDAADEIRRIASEFLPASPGAARVLVVRPFKD